MKTEIPPRVAVSILDHDLDASTTVTVRYETSNDLDQRCEAAITAFSQMIAALDALSYS